MPCIIPWSEGLITKPLTLNAQEDFPLTPFACLTASCTEKVQSQIQQDLGLKNALLVKNSFNRPNIQVMSFPLHHSLFCLLTSSCKMIEDLNCCPWLMQYHVRYKDIVDGGPGDQSILQVYSMTGLPSFPVASMLFLCMQDLVKYIQAREGQCGIVYARLRRVQYCTSRCLVAPGRPVEI